MANCSLRPTCIAPPGASRLNHNFDQTAFTLAIRTANYTCLPRETHCMWSTKKLARAPRQPSQPIEIASRGHRLPKPYTSLLKKRGKSVCTPSREVPWAANAPTHSPSHMQRYSMSFRLQKIYLQPMLDALVQAGTCTDVHYIAHILFWVLCACVWGGFSLWGIRCRALHDSWHAGSYRRLAVHAAAAGLMAAAVQATLMDVLTRV